MKGLKASRIIKHYVIEDNRIRSEFDAVNMFNTAKILMNVQIEMMGRHVLVEKDFTKTNDNDR